MNLIWFSDVQQGVAVAVLLVQLLLAFQCRTDFFAVKDLGFLCGNYMKRMSPAHHVTVRLDNK